MGRKSPQMRDLEVTIAYEVDVRYPIKDIKDIKDRCCYHGI